MAQVQFTTSNQVQLTINDNQLVAVNIFGDIFKGQLNENGKVVAKSSLSLAVLSKAMLEYRNSIN